MTLKENFTIKKMRLNQKGCALLRQGAAPLLLGVILLLFAAGLAVQGAFAGQLAKPVEGASPLHPLFPLLDANAENVLDSGEPLSTMQTCGGCHDADYIASHSFHADLGASQWVPAGTLERPWDTSPGLYGGWNPLTYRYLSPRGDSQVDLDPVGWVSFNAARVVGGGPAEAVGLEMDCFLCHLTQPAKEARDTAIRDGHAEWASTASLANTGIVTAFGYGYTWNPEAFNQQGQLDRPFVSIQDPDNANCAQCHGLVQADPEQVLTLEGCSLDDWNTATTGQVISGQRISLSGVNLADKSERNQPWDVHAERGLECTDCHYALNNPAYYLADEDSRPEHLQFDPRRLEIGEFLYRPDHNLARGPSASLTGSGDPAASMRRCESCHDAGLHADRLPYVERHMQALACESCHIPELSAPAVQFYDWTVLHADGEPASACRGVEEAENGLSSLVTGYQPVLLPRQDANSDLALAPYNLVTAWYWVYDSPEGRRPVRQADLETAWLEGDSHAPEVLAAFDADGDGSLAAPELRLDTPEKTAFITSRLADLGLENPRIQGEVQAYNINHNTVTGAWAVSDCQTCHSDDSRLAAPMTLAAYLPGGVQPEIVLDKGAPGAGELLQHGDALVYAPSGEGLYVFGHNRVNWVDWFGSLLFVGVLLAVAGHGGLRFYTALRRPSRHGAARPVYMYSVYERFWHWLQTATIVLLLLTGLVIHRPEIFGWLSFRYIVTLHNVLAAILVINAALSLFYHLASGEIQQFIPRPYGFFDQAIQQAKYYLQGIFSQSPHPFEKTPQRKMNPLQQVTYFGILNVLLPLQIITGALMWGVQRWPEVAGMLGGLPFLAPFHSLVAWSFAAFIVVHVYLTTTVGRAPMDGIKAMIYGWEEVEEEHPQQQADGNLPAGEAPVPAAD